jgi:hypothetical protein
VLRPHAVLDPFIPAFSPSNREVVTGHIYGVPLPIICVFYICFGSRKGFIFVRYDYSHCMLQCWQSCIRYEVTMLGKDFVRPTATVGHSRLQCDPMRAGFDYSGGEFLKIDVLFGPVNLTIG